MEEFLLWILSHLFEILGAISGFIYLYFSIQQKIWLWPAGIINVSFYIYIFFTSKLYADMSLQIFYLVISVYGWINWHRKSGKNKKFSVSRIPLKNAVILFITSVIGTLFIAKFLIHFTDSVVPYCDAVITVVSIAATWMLVYKYLENWLVWVIIDAFAIGVYIFKGLYPTVILFLVYTIFAIIGYFEWKKSLQKVHPTN